MYWKRTCNLPDVFHSIEVGCGLGKMSMLLGLAGARVTLLDYSMSGLAVAKKTHRALGLHPHCIVADMLRLSNKMEERFDLACSFGTLEHFSGEDRYAAFEANARLVRPGGMLFFVVPNRYGIFYRIGFGLRIMLGMTHDDFREEPYAAGELRRYARRANVEVLELASVGSLKDDLSYWIGENVKSLFRKITGMRKRHNPKRAPLGIASIDLSGNTVDRRSMLDKRFCYGLLFAGKKAAMGQDA
ncbi:MAG: class I SAM-dependent methyltransferase [Chitinispirillaceae bacterium]|nr:class I SAM-dependent methyltransferase [Chitinispirillaceae bacterium]